MASFEYVSFKSTALIQSVKNNKKPHLILTSLIQNLVRLTSHPELEEALYQLCPLITMAQPPQSSSIAQAPKNSFHLILSSSSGESSWSELAIRPP